MYKIREISRSRSQKVNLPKHIHYKYIFISLQYDNTLNQDLLDVMNRICDMIGQISTAELMSIKSIDFTQLQLLLVKRYVFTEEPEKHFNLS